MKDGDKSVKSLNVLDKYLKRFEKNLLFPNPSNLKEYDELRIFETPNKLKISNLSEENPYHILTEFFEIDFQKEEHRLNNIDDIDYQGNGFKPNLVLYYFKEGQTETIYFSEINSKTVLVKNRVFILPKVFKRSGVEDRPELKLNEVTKGLELPQSNFIAKLTKRVNKTYSVEIYDVRKLDIACRLSSHIDFYAEKKLHKFNTPDDESFKITSARTDVQIKNVEETMAIVRDTPALSKALSQYSGHGNKAINRIKKERLRDAIDRLKNYVKKNEAQYTLEDIPVFHFNENRIVVEPCQIKIFVALLDNRIVEKILTEEIELPCFD